MNKNPFLDAQKVKKRQGSKNNPFRSFTRIGAYSYFVTIPKSYFEQLKWDPKKITVRLSLKKNYIAIYPW